MAEKRIRPSFAQWTWICRKYDRSLAGRVSSIGTHLCRKDQDERLVALAMLERMARSTKDEELRRAIASWRMLGQFNPPREVPRRPEPPAGPRPLPSELDPKVPAARRWPRFSRT